jgi:hypothetical protein
MLDKIRRQVGQMEMAHKMRIKPKIEYGPEVLVPCNPKWGEKGPTVDYMEEEEEICHEFIKHFTRLQWKYLTT